MRRETRTVSLTRRLRGVDEPTESAARLHRKQPTSAEALLWSVLRNRQVTGLKFRRQQPLGPFIVDFCCAENRLVVEVDGEIHLSQTDYDNARTGYLSALGYRVIRFTNDRVLNDLDDVVLEIQNELSPHPDQEPLSCFAGEGQG